MLQSIFVCSLFELNFELTQANGTMNCLHIVHCIHYNYNLIAFTIISWKINKILAMFT